MIDLLLAITLHWSVSSEENLGGCKIYCKTEADLPVATLDVGKATKWNADKFLAGQPEGRQLFFHVRAYDAENVESDPSNVVSYVVTRPTHPPTQMSVLVPVSAPQVEGFVFDKWEVITDMDTGEITLEATYRSK